MVEKRWSFGGKLTIKDDIILRFRRFASNISLLRDKNARSIEYSASNRTEIISDFVYGSVLLLN